MISIAQLAQIADVGAPVVQTLGAGGFVWVLVTRLDRYEAAAAKREEATQHVLRELSRALWTDLAIRPYSGESVKAQAQKVLAKMDDDKS